MRKGSPGRLAPSMRTYTPKRGILRRPGLPVPLSLERKNYGQRPLLCLPSLFPLRAAFPLVMHALLVLARSLLPLRLPLRALRRCFSFAGRTRSHTSSALRVRLTAMRAGLCSRSGRSPKEERVSLAPARKRWDGCTLREEDRVACAPRGARTGGVIHTSPQAGSHPSDRDSEGLSCARPVQL